MSRTNTVNFAETIIAAPTASTTVLVGDATSSTFPNSNFYATIQQVVSNVIIKKEVVLCSTRSGTSFSVIRGQDGTTAQDFTVGGGTIYLIIATTSGHIQDIRDEIDGLVTISTPQTITGSKSFNYQLNANANLFIRNGVETIDSLRMGSGGLYGLGVNGAKITLFYHPASSGFSVGSRDGTTYTERMSMNTNGDDFTVKGQNWSTSAASRTPTRSGGITVTSITVNNAYYKIIGKTMFFNAWLDILPSSSGSYIDLSTPASGLGLSVLAGWTSDGSIISNYVASSVVNVGTNFINGVSKGVMFSGRQNLS